MEGLVNYSSEDEQDEPGYRRQAERGSPVNRGNGSYGNAGSVGRSGHRDEASDNRHKTHSGSNRSSSFQRDNKERYERSTRGARDSRDNGPQRHENRSMQHDRQYQRHGRDLKSDEFNKRERERSRPDERFNNRHSVGNSRHNQNSRDNRDNRPRHSGGNSIDNTRPRHYRFSHDGEKREVRPERYVASPPERHRHQHNKNTSHSRRSPSRSRSRSHSKDRRTSPTSERAERSAVSDMYEADSSPVREKITEKSKQNLTKPAEQSVKQIAPLMSLPLSDSAPKHPSLIAVTKTIAAGSTHSNEPAVIQLPNYYNPSVINPTKYAEQVQKRKLLWAAKKNEDTSAKWGNAQFSQDTDGKVASKFMRLMGIKNASGGKNEVEEKAAPAPAKAPDVKSREAMFSTMEHQYEVARQATHTMRGVGLGFGASRPF